MSEIHHHTVQVPATSANLGPGFDAFGVAVRRYLVVRSVPRGDQTDRVCLVDAVDGDLACDDENLVWRSFVVFCAHHGVDVPDVGLRCRSDIPLERGLGSSSSAIVAGLSLARALTGVACRDLDVVALATSIEGHPDNVAPAVLGGLVACAVDDDGAFVVRRVNPAPALRPLVLVPTQRLSTVTARAAVPDHLDTPAVVAQAARAGHVVAGLAGVWPLDARLAGDRLHEPARLAAMPASGEVITALRSFGIHAWLSGAGPSVATVVDQHDDGQLREVARIAADAGFELLDDGFDLGGTVSCPDEGCGLSGASRCVQCPRRRV